MLGKLLKEYVPGLHRLAMQINKWYIHNFQSKSPYIVDHLGGSFKTYLNDPTSADVVDKLKTGMDKESRHTVDVIVQRMLTYPDTKDRRTDKNFSNVAGGLLAAEIQSQKRLVNKHLKVSKRRYKMVPRKFDESVFYYHHGMRGLPSRVLRYIEGSDFIDCGAYIGDSALVLHDYGCRIMYSIEMSKKSIEKYKRNMKLNGISEHKYEIIQLGIADRDDRGPISLPDTGSAGFSVFRHTSKYDFIEVERKSLDYIVDKYKIHPKLIKADIEGAAKDLVLGGVKALTTYRPVLSLAIYHNPGEFFEIKPYLEDLLGDYTFMVRKLDSAVHLNHIHSEVILIAYPNETLGGV